MTKEIFNDSYDYTKYVPEYKELAEKHLADDSVHQASLLKHIKEDKDINRRCLYALEYAYSSSDGPYFTEAIPYLERLCWRMSIHLICTMCSVHDVR